jgi:hypothetical protein
MATDDIALHIGSLFGYDRLIRQQVFAALTGDGIETLEIGAIVRLAGDARGHVPGGLRAGSTAVVVGFLVPDFAPGGCTDHIVLVSDGGTVCEVKPANIDAVVKGAPRALE